MSDTFNAIQNLYPNVVTVKKTEDFVTAYEQAVASGLLSVIELQIDDEVLSTSQTVSEVRDNGK